ncbi:hypothetical protein FE810_04835 [Thalassotalea litorea]|uniref:Uncharacterized protein n=1 Tax=Thalassotalea litorea TaxID=2020715 RepID=A0A5R9IMS8_9GAMM|nr:hypothetical protein [Thalassotalea litorea]TLU66835.1 hypothetical protein FE810_04835 [Thalassotalea litorea]
MSQPDSDLMQYLHRDFVADTPKQQQEFIRQSVQKYRQHSQKRAIVFTVFGLIALLALVMFFPIQPMVEIFSSGANIEDISLPTLTLAVLPVLLISYVVVLLENSR